jgi:hypothetical protein
MGLLILSIIVISNWSIGNREDKAIVILLENNRFQEPIKGKNKKKVQDVPNHFGKGC